MKDQINNDKGFLKEKLGNYQVDPPASVWNVISAGLGGRSRRGMLIITLAAAASFALAVTLGINYFGPEIQESSEMAEAPEQASRKLTPAKADEPMDTEVSSKEARKGTLETRVTNTLADLAARDGIIEEPHLAEEVLIIEDQLQIEGELRVEEELPLVMGTPSGSEVMKMNPAPDAIEVNPAQPEDLVLDAGETVIQDPLPDMEETWKQDPRWMLGAALSPLYTFRDAEAQAMSPDYESGMVSYAGGVQVGYKTTRRLAIESGVFYNKMGIEVGAPGIQLFSDEAEFDPLGSEIEQSSIMAISNSVGNIVSNAGDIYVNNYKVNDEYESNSPTDMWGARSVDAEQGIRQNLDYLEIPLNLRYTIVDRSFKLQVVGGMSTNLLVNNSVTMETAEGTTEIGYLANIRNVNYSGNAGIGFRYHFLDHFSLSLEPRFRYFLHSVNDATLPSTRPYTFGIYTGLNFLF